MPTRFHDSYDSDGVRAAFEAFDTDRIVIKPTVSANALHTVVLDMDRLPHREPELAALFAGRANMLQPFYASVLRLGEYSLCFFDRDYSHAILKTPAEGDFRTQEEHGSDIRPYAADDAMLGLATRMTASLSEPVAYARVDLVLNDADSPELMELELIEPSLYFRTDPESPARFAKGITDFYQRKASR